MPYFQHAEDIWSGFPELAAGVVFAAGVGGDAEVGSRLDEFTAVAAARLETGPESLFPEVQAWRRAFTRMGLKPTQYRCASESLLRRFRKERSLPRIHPVVDLCNAISLAYAVPVAVFDADRIAGPGLEVRHARGDESYLTFGGGTERPGAGEVIFADSAGRAHARRWSNRQSGYSAVGEGTIRILIVPEAMHDTAAADVARLTAAVADELSALWPVAPRTAALSRSAPRFEY